MAVIDKEHRDTKIFLNFINGNTERNLAREYDLCVSYVRQLIKRFARDLKRKDPQLFKEIENEVKIPEIELHSESEINNLSQEITAAPTAIYFLLRDNKIVYVGQSINIYSRIGEHFEDRKIKFNRFSIIPCKKENLEILETFYIHKFNPIYNKQRDFWSNILCDLKDARENAKRECSSQ